MKRYLCIGLLLIVCLSLAACDLKVNFNLNHIEDTNGADDYSLTTITKEELLGNSGAVKLLSVRSEGNDKIEYSVDKFTGVEMVEEVRVKDGVGSITFAVNTALTEGNMYVYVRCDGQIVGELAIGKDDALTIEKPTPGKYELCIAGESAKFKMVIQITQN